MSWGTGWRVWEMAGRWRRTQVLSILGYCLLYSKISKSSISTLIAAVCFKDPHAIYMHLKPCLLLPLNQPLAHTRLMVQPPFLTQATPQSFPDVSLMGWGATPHFPLWREWTGSRRKMKLSSGQGRAGVTMQTMAGSGPEPTGWSQIRALSPAELGGWVSVTRSKAWLLSSLAGKKGKELGRGPAESRTWHPGALRGATQKEQGNAPENPGEARAQWLTTGRPQTGWALLPSPPLVLVFHPSTPRQETEGLFSGETEPEELMSGALGTRGRTAGRGQRTREEQHQRPAEHCLQTPRRGRGSPPLPAPQTPARQGHPWKRAFWRSDILKDKDSRW